METRSNSSKRKGGFNRGPGGRQFDNVQRNDRFKNSESIGNQDRNNGQRNNTGNFRGRGKGRGRGRFDKSPNVRRPRVASKTVDKDKMRCHYCNEYGHFIRECSTKQGILMV